MQQKYLKAVREWCHAASDEHDEMVCEMIFGLSLERDQEDAEGFEIAVNYLADNLTGQMLRDFYYRIAWRAEWKTTHRAHEWNPRTILVWGVPFALSAALWMEAYREAWTRAYLALAWCACAMPKINNGPLGDIIDALARDTLEQAERRCALMLKDEKPWSGGSWSKPPVQWSRADDHFKELMRRAPARVSSQISLEDFVLCAATEIAARNGADQLRDTSRHTSKVIE